MFSQAQGETRPGLNGSIIKRLVIPLPPFSEQERISAEVDRLVSLGNEAHSIIAAVNGRCGRLRQSILKWAFEGKLADQDPNDEPASVLLDGIRAERQQKGKKPGISDRREQGRETGEQLELPVSSSK